MLYQGIIVAGLFIFMINLTLNLRKIRTLRPDEKVPEPAPFISVLVPARDEEANITACLESLQQQDYPNYEIVVLDDNSSDSTGAIVEYIGWVDFFLLCAVIALPGMLLLFWVAPWSERK